MTGRGRARLGKAQREYLSEAEEILERMRLDLADLADACDRSAEVAPALVNRLFRSAHTLKGISGVSGLDAIAALAHRLEDLLDALRMGRLEDASSASALLDEAVRLLAAALAGFGQHGDLAATAGELDALAARIEQASRASAASGAAPDPTPLDPALLRALTQYEEHRLRENLRRGHHLHAVELCLELDDFEDTLRSVSRAAQQVGEVLSTLPSPGRAAASEIHFTVLVATPLESARLAAHLSLEPGSVRQLSPRTAAAGAGSVRHGPRPVATESLRSISGSVRVDIRKLDELMSLVGELVLQRGHLAGLAERLAADPATARAGVELRAQQRALERRLQELQAGVLDVRMVPLRQIFEKLKRAAKQLRRELGKEVELEIVGADTELDKLIVEELVDPLLHLLRNALDHAIETPEERIALGKARQGRVRLEAAQRGHHVLIRVADDGRGIDARALRARAEAAGLVAPDAVLGASETLELAFAPGLSTRSQVSETSGRGVGMDVVRSNVAALGGIVELDSEPGRGTRVTVTLPITLAIVQALLVEAGGQCFAVPLGAVLETLPVEPADIQRSQGRELIELRGEPLLLRRLAAAFDLAIDADRRAFAVVVGIGDARLGLLVDRLEGQRDALIKPICGPAARVRGIAGATELPDRGAVLVVDVAALVDEADPHRRAA